METGREREGEMVSTSVSPIVQAEREQTVCETVHTYIHCTANYVVFPPSNKHHCLYIYNVYSTLCVDVRGYHVHGVHDDISQLNQYK